MNNTSFEASTTTGLPANYVSTSGLPANYVSTSGLADNGSNGASGLAVGLSIGGVLLAAILVFIVAYCFFSRRKDSQSDSHSDNNNVQRISMNSENFSHVTNLRQLEPMDAKNAKAIPKRTKPTLDEKREAGKADDLSDVDLSLFSGDGQLNPAFVDDEDLDHGNSKTSATDDNVVVSATDDNVVVFRLEGVVKFDVSQMVGIDRNIALSLENQTGGQVQKIIASNGEVKNLRDNDGSVVTKQQYKLTDTQDANTGQTRHDAVEYKAKQTNASENNQSSNVTDSKRIVNYETVASANSRKSSSERTQPRIDVVEDIRPGTSKVKLPTIITTSVDEEDVIQVITEDPPFSSDERNGPADKPDYVAVVMGDSHVSDKAGSSQTKDDKPISTKQMSFQERNFSVIEKSIDMEDEVYRRKPSGRGKQVTTIYIGDNNAASVKDKRRGRHDKIVFKSNPKTENSSGKSEHKKRHLENEPPLKGKDMNVPVKAQSGEIDKVKISRQWSSDKPIEYSNPSFPITQSENNVKRKGKKVPTKPVLTREASAYEIPWDLTDVGALLMQINDIAESDDRVS